MMNKVKEILKEMLLQRVLLLAEFEPNDTLLASYITVARER